MLNPTIFLLGAMVIRGGALNFTQYSQDDYIFISERFEVVRYDIKYFSNPVVKNFKYNRTDFAINFTFTFEADLNNELIAHFQAYKFSSNEYRLFPITFPVNACDALNRNIFGLQNVYKCGNVFRCPIKKGTYKACNWQPDYHKFPPHAPRGQYMFKIQWKFMSTEIMLGQWYWAVKDVPLY